MTIKNDVVLCKNGFRIIALVLAVFLAAPVCVGRVFAEEEQGSLTVDQVAAVIEAQVRAFAASIGL